MAHFLPLPKGLTGSSTEALVFIASTHTSPTRHRVLWRVSVADAKKICSDPRTAGSNYMLCYTTANIDDPTSFVYVPDNGRHAEVLRDHSIRVIHAHTATQTLPAELGR